MKKVIIKNNNFTLCHNLKEATNLIERMRGLMFSKKMEDFDGLLIRPCNSIHTFFMKYPIDTIFLDSKFKVVKIIRNMHPWKISWIYFKAKQVLELPANTIPTDLNENDQVEVLCTN